MCIESNDALATSLAKPLAGVADTKAGQLSEAATPRMTNSARGTARAGATGADLIDVAGPHAEVMSLDGILIWIFIARSSVGKAGDPVRRLANHRYALATRTVPPLMRAGKL
jgi:hypothetical protein